MPTSPFDDLRQEHASLLYEAGEIRSTIKGLSGEERVSLGGGGVVRDELEMFGRKLKLHFRREEEALFPEARRLLSEGARGADIFGTFFAAEAEDDMSAHVSLTTRVNEMIATAEQLQETEAREGGSVRTLLSVMTLTFNLLQRHAAKEETLIFPMLENSLTEAHIDEIRSRLQEIGSSRDLTSGDGGEQIRQLGGET